VDTFEEPMMDFGRDRYANFRMECPKPDADIRSYAVSVLKTVLTPEPEAVGNDMVSIMKHGIREAEPSDREKACVPSNGYQKPAPTKHLLPSCSRRYFSMGRQSAGLLSTTGELEIKPTSSRAILITPRKPSRSIQDLSGFSPEDINYRC
jgi:hypothetical protein